MFKTLRFRLTLGHALVFGGVALGVMGFAYLTVSNQLLASISEDLRDTVQEFRDLYEEHGIKELRNEIARESLSHGANNFFARFIGINGKVMAQTMPQTWKFPLPEPKSTKKGEQWFEVGVNDKGEVAKIVSVTIQGRGWLQVGLSLRSYHLQLNNIQQGFGWAFLVIVVVGVLTGWWQVSRALAGVDQVRRAAIDIGDGAFEHRLSLAGHGQELVELADAFNVMLDKIQRLLGEMRDVSDNIAHDLRTPITRIRGMAEAGLMMKTDRESKKREIMAPIIDECDRLTNMINTMLEIAQTDSGVTNLERTPVNLTMLLTDACELFMPVAEDADIKMRIEIGDAPVTINGDGARLQRVIANLLDNALKFTSQDGSVLIRCDQTESEVHIIVEDTGIGISENDIPYVFDRFYRSDQSRSTPGNGLGLSYAKSIANAHGGNIHIDSQYGRGTKITLILPIA